LREHALMAGLQLPRVETILDASVVSVARIEDGDLSGSVARAVELLGEPDCVLPRKGDVVLIKPNIGWNRTWETGTTTNPDFVRAIVELLRERGPSRVIVGESPSIGMDGADVFEATGYDKLTDEGVEVVDLGQDDLIHVPLPGPSLLGKVLLPSTYLHADYFLNVPVIKTHVNTCVTLSMKNLKGLLPKREKRRFHFLGLDRCIAELASVVRNDLILVDGEVGQEGLGPISGDRVPLGLVVGGANPVAVDATCINIMGIPCDRVKHLAIALEAGTDPPPDRLIHVGDAIPSVSRPFRLPPESLSRAFPGVRVVEGNACSGCVGALTVSLDRMARSGEIEMLRETLGCINIAIGPDADIPDDGSGNWVIVGNCLKRHSQRGSFVPGCSPQGWYVRDAIRKMMGLPPLFADESLLCDGAQ
jgi:uncharacterized protein (DUF362 family)